MQRETWERLTCAYSEWVHDRFEDSGTSRLRNALERFGEANLKEKLGRRPRQQRRGREQEEYADEPEYASTMNLVGLERN